MGLLQASMAAAEVETVKIPITGTSLNVLGPTSDVLHICPTSQKAAKLLPGAVIQKESMMDPHGFSVVSTSHATASVSATTAENQDVTVPSELLLRPSYLQQQLVPGP